MEELNEHLIETYARAPESLDPRVKSYIESQLARSEDVRTLVDYWIQFYEELGRQENATSPLVERLADRLFVPSIIELRPVTSPDLSTERITVLAALTDDPAPTHRFETIATLGDEDKGILVRIVFDNLRRMGRLYVLSDREDEKQFAVISVPDLPMNVVTDASGQCEFQLNEAGRARLRRLNRMLLHRHVATHEVRPSDLEATGAKEHNLDDSYKLEVQRRGERLHVLVTQTDDAPPVTWLAVEFDDGSPRLLRMEEGACDLHLEEGTSRLTLRFYH